MGQTLLLRGGYLVDPGTGLEGYADLFVEDGVIAEVGSFGERQADRVLDVTGCTVFPGLVDLHVHLRDPGQTHKEDLRSGSLAAARGGVTTLVAMPNTTPPMDTAEKLRTLQERAESEAPVHICQASAITVNMAGEELVDIEGILESGFRVFSEDGKSVMKASLMREAMRRIAAGDGLICDHCEDSSLVQGGVMNQDENALRLGLPGIANEVEDVIAVREAILAGATGVRLHLCHCSTADSVEILRGAKARGVRITGEVCPHHFILTSSDIPEDDGNYKMNPPLRTRKDVEALRRGLREGIIDCISTDHAPHTVKEKSGGFLGSPFGIVGLESSAALTYTELVEGGVLTLMQMAEKMSRNPARILGVPGGTLAIGSPADIAVFDFGASYRLDPEEFVSRGRNTPFTGREVRGRTKYTIVKGSVVYEDKEA